MAQAGWTYTDLFGRKFYIGLYHGDESGHVVLYVNNKISIIDFNINDSKNYAIYIGRDLLKIELDNSSGDFTYRLSMDESIKAKPDYPSWYMKVIKVILIILVLLYVGMLWLLLS